LIDARPALVELWRAISRNYVRFPCREKLRWIFPLSSTGWDNPSPAKPVALGSFRLYDRAPPSSRRRSCILKGLDGPAQGFSRRLAIHGFRASPGSGSDVTKNAGTCRAAGFFGGPEVPQKKKNPLVRGTTGKNAGAPCFSAALKPPPTSTGRTAAINKGTCFRANRKLDGTRRAPDTLSRGWMLNCHGSLPQQKSIAIMSPTAAARAAIVTRACAAGNFRYLRRVGGRTLPGRNTIEEREMIHVFGVRNTTFCFPADDAT